MMTIHLLMMIITPLTLTIIPLTLTISPLIMKTMDGKSSPLYRLSLKMLKEEHSGWLPGSNGHAWQV